MEQTAKHRMRPALVAMICLTCLACAPALAGGGHYEDGIFIPDGVCVSGCDPEPIVGPGDRSGEDRDDAALAERARQAEQERQLQQRHKEARETNLQGVELYRKRDWPGALALFLEAIEKDPGNSTYLFNRNDAIAMMANDRGLVFYEKGDWANAIASYQEALKSYSVSHDHSVIRQNLADAQAQLRMQQQSRAAADGMRQAIRDHAQTLEATPPLDGLDFAEESQPSETRPASVQKNDDPRVVVGRNVPGSTDAGAQLKSVERHSRDAQSQRRDSDKETARMGFDVAGAESGNLVYPDKNRHQQVPPTALDKQIPRGAKDDQRIKQMQAWYRSLDARKAEKEKMIAEIKAQQKTSKDPSLGVKIDTLTNDVKRLTEDQVKATDAVHKRVEAIKKQTLDKGLEWDEEPATDTPRAKGSGTKG